MDFTFSEEQLEIRELAAKLFTERATAERVRAAERTDDRIDRELWADLASTGLLGLALPESAGGAGLGLSELCLVLEQQGRHVAPVPLWQTAVVALAVAEFGTDEQRRALLPGVAGGTLIATVGLEEFGVGAPDHPATTASEDSTGWQLAGTKAAVPYAHLADRVVVSAMTPSGAALFLIDSRDPSVTVERVDTSAHEPAAHLTLAGTPAESLGDAGALLWLIDRVQVAVAAAHLGVADSATAQAARYVSEREQFGRPLGTFHAVQHALADCYLDVAAMRVTLWQAAWLLDSGEPAGTAVGVAAWWAADGGARVVHRVQHLHGGIGVDVDYPIHRFLLWGKQLAGLFGGAAARLQRLGDTIATAGAVP
jgi:alkylation response protein AidB-like acyl-CoA dehydrogenase